jgi:phosphoribosylanthranilate isomerase
MIVQIYEIQTPHEAEQCIEAGVDHIGSVIVSQSEWRQPEIREVVRVGDGTLVKNSIIPLFQDMDTLFRILDYYKPDFIHFCESVANNDGRAVDLDAFIHIQEQIREGFPDIGIIRSVPIPADSTIANFPTLHIAKTLEPSTDFFLTDTWLGEEPVEGFIGITGKRCHAGLAKELIIQSEIPVILAGGLSSDNVYDAIMDIRPSGADSCTLTNAVDPQRKPVRFQKDFTRVKRFVDQVRKSEKDLLKIKEGLKVEILTLKEQLRDREAALPAHSIRPHQIQAIERLEEIIEQKEKELRFYPPDPSP